jgi:hypothetical protein
MIRMAPSALVIFPATIISDSISRIVEGCPARPGLHMKNR